MAQFVYLLRPAFDAAFTASATPEQQAIVDEHGDYLEALRAAGRLVLAGRCLDGAFGAVVVEASDEQAAGRIVAEDPSVAAGIQQAELHPFMVWLQGSAA